MDGHPPDLDVRYGSRGLSSQSELRELELSFNNSLQPKLSPFLQLFLDPALGLPQLSNLKKLEKLAVTGQAHHFGQREIEWMPQNWRRLYSIQVPILYESTQVVSCTRHNFSGQEPEYHRWFAQLRTAGVP
ncbi:MAG: hypothetical protein BYD32DRAFT_466648 [Podila humilis]|nr:MAG: hypothetical protein BYD32DRAFT_466648 [Podila humilis]